MQPKISVVMPVWNGEKYLAEAIDSIFAQTFPDFELLVIDDGSTDGTLDILHSYRDSRLKIHRLNHGGIVLALNHGIANARAEWIARQDADDHSLPVRFESQWNALRNNPNAVLCFTNVELFGTGQSLPKQARFPRTTALLALRMCFQCPIVHSSVLFRKDVFNKCGGYRPDERHAEDFAAWGRMLKIGPLIGLAERLVRFRLHEGSVSQKNLDAQAALAKKIATDHCEWLMKLAPADAVRAHAALSPAESIRMGEWLWFLTRCAPRLRWQSLEMWAWLSLQTLKRSVGAR